MSLRPSQQNRPGTGERKGKRIEFAPFGALETAPPAARFNGPGAVSPEKILLYPEEDFFL